VKFGSTINQPKTNSIIKKKNQEKFTSDFPNHFNNLDDLIKQFDNTWKLRSYKNGIKIYKHALRNENMKLNEKKKILSYSFLFVLIMIFLKDYPNIALSLILITILGVFLYSKSNKNNNVTKEFIVKSFVFHFNELVG
jgi:hypothetical protein